MKDLAQRGIVALCVLISVSAFAEEKGYQNHDKDAMRAEKVTAHKQKILSNLNDEKVAIEQTISCVSAAQAQDAIEKCREIRHLAAQKIKERHFAGRREQLQNELKRLDEEEKSIKSSK